MSKMVSKSTLAAGIALAMAFTISCSSGDKGDGGGSSFTDSRDNKPTKEI